jgi:hypothetical protein
MLELAYLNAGFLKQEYMQYIKKAESKFGLIEFYSTYDIQIDPNDWNCIQYVSKDLNGRVIAYFGASINRGFNIVSELVVLNFTDYPNTVWVLDFIKFLDILLIEKNFRKAVLYTIADNRYFSKCEQFLLKHNLFREVGVMKNHCVLNDGQVYDMKILEIEKKNLKKWKVKG